MLFLLACTSDPIRLGPDPGAAPADIDVAGTLTFGDVGVGTSNSRVITVTNVGDGPLTIDSIALDDADVLSVSIDGGPESSWAGPLDPLETGATIALTVTYTPSEATCISADLTIHSDDPVEPIVSVPVLGCGSETSRAVSLVLNVDDNWSAWLDGQEFTADDAQGYYYTDTIVWDLLPGAHLLAIQGENTGGLGGLVGAVFVEDRAVTVSGDGSWLVMDRQPGDVWTTDAYDDSRWEAASPCVEPTWDAESSGAAGEAGAAWVDVSSDCRDDTDSWFRVWFTVE